MMVPPVVDDDPVRHRRAAFAFRFREILDRHRAFDALGQERRDVGRPGVPGAEQKEQRKNRGFPAGNGRHGFRMKSETWRSRTVSNRVGPGLAM